MNSKTTSKISLSQDREDIQIVDPSVTNYLNIFKVLFILSTKDTILPEVFEIFGTEAGIKFLDIFAGTTIEVPDRTVINDIVRDVDIYVTTEKEGKHKNKELAAKYEIDANTVIKIHHTVRDTLIKVGMRKNE